jgi:hypothetical protein
MSVEATTATAAPSRRAILVAAALAFAAATVLLVAIVLPAEYGIDPVGTGRALGLTALGQGAADAPVPPPSGERLAPTMKGPVALYPAGFKVDAREFTLGPYEYVEYKYRMERGATLLFSWQADGGVVQDLHSVPEGGASKNEQSFDNQPRRQADGSFAAPFSGIHGWFWENPGGASVRVRVTTAGFYSSVQEFHFDGRRETREVRGLDAIPVSRP